MKKLLLFFCLAFVYQIGSAQFFDIAELPNKYRGFYFGGGPRTINTTPGTLITSFVDNSPSMDNFTTTTELLDSYSGGAFQFGFKFGHYSGLSHSIGFEISSGEASGGIFTYSIGYSKSKIVGSGIVVVRPNIYGGFGNFGFDMGRIENNAGYIQINEKQYYQEYLDVDLNSQVFLWGPSLDIYWMAHDHVSAYFNVSYDLASDNSNPQLVFSPPSTPGEESSATSSSVSIDGENPNVSFDGDKLTRLPYDIGGMRIGVGVAITWQKY